MQSTKYAIGLLVSCGTRWSWAASTSGLAAELYAARDNLSPHPWFADTYRAGIIAPVVAGAGR